MIKKHLTYSAPMGLLPIERLFGRLSWTFFAAMLFISAPLSATTVTIGNFSGVSTNMSFAAGTWSPTGSPAQLDVLDLAAKLNLGDVTVTTNGAGDLIFTMGQFSYSAPAVRMLTLTASGNINMSQVGSGGSAVHCLVNAGGNVTVDNPGWKTNGGNFTIASAVGVTLSGTNVLTGGGNFSCTSSSLLSQNNGVATGGGNASIVATGNIQILDGGFSTCGSLTNGFFTAQGVDFTMSSQEIRTCGGNVTINHTGNVTATATTGGGFFMSSGKDFNGINSGINTTRIGGVGGNVSLQHAGYNIVTQSNGVNTGGGAFTAQGVNITFKDAGLSTSRTGNPGGQVTLTATGNVLIRDGGVNTGGGNFSCTSTSLITQNAGVITGGGNASIIATGNVQILDGGFSTCGSSTNGNFTSQGVDFTMNSQDIRTCGGNVTLNHTGNVTVIASTGGGFFMSSGKDFSCINSGINTTRVGGVGGNVTLQHTGYNIVTQFAGVQTGGGAFVAQGVDITIRDGGLSTSRTGNPGGQVTLTATGNVLIQSSGIQTGGGSFSSTGINLQSEGSGINTTRSGFTGGSVTLTHTGTVLTQNGGVYTGGGAFAAQGGDITIKDGGLNTSRASNPGGQATLTATGNVLIQNSSVQTGGGSFSSTGINFQSEGNGINTTRSGFTGGSVTLRHTGTVLIQNGGVGTGGGDFACTHASSTIIQGGGVYTSGGNFQSAGSGLFSSSGNGLQLGAAASVCIVHNGISITQGGMQGTNSAANILLQAGNNPVILENLLLRGSLKVRGGATTLSAGGITSNGGPLQVDIKSLSTITIDNQLLSGGGNISLQALGNITLMNSNTALRSIGGSISLTSKTGIVSNGTAGNGGGISSAPGSGGVLTQIGGSITLAQPPVVGAGNITLTTDPAFTVSIGVVCKNAAATVSTSITPNDVLSAVGADNFCSSDVLYSLDKSTFGCTDIPSTIVTLTVTDVDGSNSSCTATVTVTDDVLPGITCPGNISRNADPNQCSAVVSYSVVGSDNCAGYTLSRTSGPASSDPFPKGETIVTWKVTDASGLTKTCSFTVTVADNTPPSIACPANIVRSTDPGQCSAVVTYAIPTYSDNCPGAGLDHISGGTSGSTFQKGTTSIIWQATDAVNLTRRCTFTITVTDNQAPTIACPLNLTRSTSPGACSAVVAYANPTYSDNCSGAGIDHVSGGTSGSTFLKGTTTVTWKATDAAGLTKTCTFRVTVNDTEAPSISCPASQSVNTTGSTCASAAVSYTTPTAMDNCPSPAPAVTRTGGLASGSLFPKGTNTVIWRAMDGAGNTKTCSFTVTVTDNVAPSITCPGNIAVTAAPGQCSTVATYTTPTATDNCGVASVVLTGGLASYSIFPEGVTTNTWRAMDDSGLTTTCTFTVTVSCGTGNEQVVERSEKLAAQATDGEPLIALILTPNPASTEVQVRIENLGETGGDLTVLDAQGRWILRQKVAAGQSQVVLNLSDRWSPGVYMVALQADGKRTVQRLVVSR